MKTRLVIVASHPVQYHAPLFRELAKKVDLTVLYAHRDTKADQAKAGFGTGFQWDVNLLSGYQHKFLVNVARQPGLGRFGGVDTPGIREEIRSGRFDAVLVLGWYLKAFIQAILAAKAYGLPILVRGDSQLDTPRSWLKRIGKAFAYPPFLRIFDAALVVGQRNRAYWQHYLYPANRIFSSPHCVNTEWFSENATRESRHSIRSRLGIDAQAPVALFAGKLVPFKRPQDLVYAAARVRDAGFPLEILVAGAGELEPELRLIAASNRVPLHLLGFCNQTEMPAAYAAADVLALPSNGRETWGLVANEALACGVPLVVSDAAGCAPDMAADGVVGMTYPCGDVTALAEALMAVLSAPPSASAVLRRSQAHSLEAASAGILAALRATVPGSSD